MAKSATVFASASMCCRFASGHRVGLLAGTLPRQLVL